MTTTRAAGRCCDDPNCCVEPSGSATIPIITKALPRVHALARWRGLLPAVAMLVAVSLWGQAFVATKIALREAPPFTIAFLRFFVAACVLFPVWRISSPRTNFSRKDRGYLLLSSLFGVALYFSLVNLGLRYTTATNAALFMAGIPAFCFLAEALWSRSAIPWRRGLGIAVSIVGVFLVVGQGPVLGGWNQLPGDVLVIAGTLCWAAYSLVGRALHEHPRLTVVTLQAAYGMLMLSPLALLESWRWQSISMECALSILYLGVMCSAVTYLLYNYALKAWAASQVSAFLNLVPVIGVISAAAVLGEDIRLTQIIGGAVILAGVFVSSRSESS